MGSSSSSTCGASLAIEGLSVGYGRVPVLRDFSLTIAAGEVVALVGPNGAGKSTLVKAVSGMLRRGAGSIRLDGRELSAMPPHEIARAGAIQVPETRDIFGGMTVWENLKVAFDNLDPGSDQKVAFSGVFELFPILADRRQQLAGNLSGGQQQMLAIARALLGKPRVLMLDEPSLGLAAIVIETIFAALERLRGTGITMLLVEQNASKAIAFADRSVVLVNGKIVLTGPRQSVLASGELVKHYLGATP